MPQPSVSSALHRALITDYLDAYFSRKIVAAREIHPRYESLWREIERVSGSGKRLRPLMVIMAYEAFGGVDVSRAIPAAAACELLHVAMLVHDDIIDRDRLRHGQPTIQAAYETRYAGEVADPAVRDHNALGAAILGGDLLLSDARAMMTRADASAEALAHAGRVFDQAVFEVAGGELLDVESAGAPRGSVDALSVMTHKTASYSFVGPLLIGAVLAEASAANQKVLRSFALNLGIAFQLTDDILGVFGNTDETGKPNDGDIHEGKATYLIERFYGLAPAGDVARFEALYGNPKTSAAGCADVRRLLEGSGALRSTERQVATYTARANADLARLPLSAESRAAFETLVRLSTDRTS